LCLTPLPDGNPDAHTPVVVDVVEADASDAVEVVVEADVDAFAVVLSVDIVDVVEAKVVDGSAVVVLIGEVVVTAVFVQVGLVPTKALLLWHVNSVTLPS
jgi:hypothetical protein